jgi:sterol desaturase/sphingolipid hydroxylase (fatty acid hydroxylase superfamily)
VEELLLNNEPAIYAAMFTGSFCIVALWESFTPRRKLVAPISLRWFSNACLLVITTVLLWAIYPAIGIGSSVLAANQGWGILRYVELPYWLAFVLSILLLDLGHYLIHYAFHRIPVLWRMHRLHHTDQDFDVTTAVRFHPFEAALEPGMNLVVVLLLGPPILAVLLFQFSYLITIFWVHGNLRMPGDTDRYLRWLLVTPDMHRTHHSQDSAESNSNYGGLFSVWDRLLGNYVDGPALGHEGMAIGQPGFTGPEHNRIDMMLMNPFLSDECAEEESDVSTVAVATQE